jgi:hypothetical protein
MEPIRFVHMAGLVYISEPEGAKTGEYYPKAEADAEIARLKSSLTEFERVRNEKKSKIIDLRRKLARLVEASREWHNSEDCRVEGRTDCALCKAIAAAKEGDNG